MEFVTIHDLSREFNVPARVIRYRLINAIAEGKLKEHDDYRRDDFKDEQHFVWKINPISFMRATALKPATLVNPIDNTMLTPVDKTDNQPLTTVNQGEEHDANSSGELLPTVNQTANKTDTSEPSLAREMIDLLKEQIKVKDGQLKDQGEQLKETHELNMKLTGTMLQQSQKIENLLRLTEGKTEAPGKVVNEGGVVSEPADVATA